MKTRKVGAILTCALLTLLLATGCLPFWGTACDPCHDITCVYGECMEGDCVCEQGYEGTDCASPYNAKFSGPFSLQETCNPFDPSAYSISLAPDTATVDEVWLSGLARDSTSLLKAYINIENTRHLSIPRQAHGTSGNDIEAQATMDASYLTIAYDYTLYQGTTILKQCQGTMFK